jgi:phosphatidylinositol-3-phosphatase
MSLMARRLTLIAPTAMLVALSACNGVTAPKPTTTAPPGSPSPVAEGSPSPAPSAVQPRPTGAASGSVFVIIMENKSYDEALRGTYTASLASQYAIATNYHAVSHPSEPNYLALTSGSTWGATDDSYRALPPGGIGQQLTDAGLSWRAYMEGLPSSCMRNQYPYALKHDPFPFYGGSCAGVASTDALPRDLTHSTPRFVWISPGLCNDTHDCPVATGDRWLSQVVPEIINSAGWRADGVLFLTWDEDDGSAQNRVATLVIAPNLKQHRSASPYTHYSLLATIEDRLGVDRLGAAVGTAPMDDLLAP